MASSFRPVKGSIVAAITTRSDFIGTARRDLGCRLLADPAMDVDEVACLLGYQDTTSFYRAFREWEGMTPSRWREIHGTGRAVVH